MSDYGCPKKKSFNEFFFRKTGFSNWAAVRGGSPSGCTNWATPPYSPLMSAEKWFHGPETWPIFWNTILRSGYRTRPSLDFGDQTFDGAIFGFNGLMQIPGRARRLQALDEIYRILRPGSWFVFTAHDRHASENSRYWKAESRRWKEGRQEADLLDFGDRVGATQWGDMYIHVPESNEMRADLKKAGFRVEADALRSQLADEPEIVKQFSDECRFWIAQRPK